MQRSLIFTLVALAAMAVAASASPVIYSQAYDMDSFLGYNSTTRYDGDFLVNSPLLQCFTDYNYDGSYSITDFHWWGFDFHGVSPDAFRFEIWTDDGFDNPLDRVFSQFSLGSSVLSEGTGDLFNGVEVLKYNLDLASVWSGAAGKYWFSIVGYYDESSDDQYFLGQTDDFYGSPDWQYNFLSDTWQNTQFADFAFEVTGEASAIPEPATMALFGLGLSLLGGSLRRRKRNR